MLQNIQNMPSFTVAPNSSNNNVQNVLRKIAGTSSEVPQFKGSGIIKVKRKSNNNTAGNGLTYLPRDAINVQDHNEGYYSQ